MNWLNEGFASLIQNYGSEAVLFVFRDVVARSALVLSDASHE